MNPALKYEEPGGKASAVLAVLVHVLLIGFLVVGVRWQSTKPEAVVVELWDRAPVLEEPPPAPPKVEPPPQPKAEPKIEPKPEPKVEPKPSKPDIAVEREKKPPKKEPPKKKDPPKKEPPKKEPPKKAEEEPPLKLDPKQRIDEELARELEALKQPKQPSQATRATAPPPSPDAGYVGKIRGKIRSNIVLPQNISGNPEAEFAIVQLPTGEVLSVTMTRSSGNKLLDDAIERAVRKSSPLPLPDRPDQFRRELRIKYSPLD
jgi:colicin import membrane protein